MSAKEVTQENTPYIYIYIYMIVCIYIYINYIYIYILTICSPSALSGEMLLAARSSRLQLQGQRPWMVHSASQGQTLGRNLTLSEAQSRARGLGQLQEKTAECGLGITSG